MFTPWGPGYDCNSHLLRVGSHNNNGMYVYRHNIPKDNLIFKLVMMFFEKERKKQSIYRKAGIILLFCANVILFIADHFSKSCKAK